MSNPNPSTSENGSALPLRPALRGTDSDVPMSPKSSSTKVVSIAESDEEIPPNPLAEEPTRPKIFTASTSGKRLTGRMSANSSSRVSLASQSSLDDLTMPESSRTEERQRSSHHHHHHQNHHHDKLISQVAEWLQAEKAKRAAKKSKKRGKEADTPVEVEESSSSKTSATSRPRTSSQSSDSSAISLERLQRILEDNMSSFGLEQLPSGITTPRRVSQSHKRRGSLLRKLGAGSSDTENQDGDVVVPSCDAVLDNSKTMSYAGGATESSDMTVTLKTSHRAEKEREAWSVFKSEILRLAHTLRLKGWRRVPLDNSDEIEVKRLSGALTNAVYVVSPPAELAPTDIPNSNPRPHALKPPNKLLLRIYGPQVEHLIDRENELSILKRLARKKIGPRLLGTFQNGRFEEYFNAQTLTPEDLIDPDTSKQIAKRMRELHEGIELLDREREEGPFIWLNWDKWEDKCEEVITYLDKEISSGNEGKGEDWRRRGLICGVEWPLFKTTVAKYRKWLNELYGKRGVEGSLVFAHNDTQYGNILRLVPESPAAGSAPSPLLLPQNTHKQLVVIDFEYASANTPGLEFANHFTEWCYNYHDANKPWACSIDRYPTIEQQRRFVRSYVNHRPQFNPRASATPKLGAMDGLAKGSISEFLLDSRTPGGSAAVENNYAEEEARRELDCDRQVTELLKETRIWRVANSAQWVAWGIVQAKIPELASNESPAGDSTESSSTTETETDIGEKQPGSGKGASEEPPAEDEEEEFDYLAYAQDRAFFFWGDVVGLGLVKKEELPQKLRDRLKIVPY